MMTTAPHATTETSDFQIATSTAPNSIPGQYVEDIANSIRQHNTNQLRATCMQLHIAHWHLGDATYLDETHRASETNGLVKLIALTAIPQVGRSLQKLILDVSGPRSRNDLLHTTLQTQPTTLGWQATLTVPWVDLGGGRAPVEQMAELALTRLLENLGLVGPRPKVLIAYDRGWEASSTRTKGKKIGDRNCDILLTPFLSAWAKTSHRIQSLEIVGETGCATLNPESALGKGDFTAYASLRHLDLDLQQRDTSQPPHKLLRLLEAAKHIEKLKIRWNLTATTAGQQLFKALQTAITRSHTIRDLTLHGLHCSSIELIGIFWRVRATLRSPKLTRVELSDVCITDVEQGGGWEEVLEYLATGFDLREMKLNFLCGDGAGVWGIDGQAMEVAVMGRVEVEHTLEKMRGRGSWMKMQGKVKSRRKR